MSGNTLKYLTQVSSFLKVPAGKLTVNSDTLPARIYENTTTTGFLNIIFSLLKSSNLQVSGKVNEDVGEIRQWLEYAIVYASGSDSGQNLNQILTELNGFLSTRTYLVSDVLTIADVVLYFTLQNAMGKLTYLEKEKFINVSRWFDNIQNVKEIKQMSGIIDFSTIYLSSIVPARH